VKVLVTGANGFVGRRLVRRLADEGHEVGAGSGPGAPLPPEARADRRVCWLALDVTEPRSVDEFLRSGGRCDALVHLAGVASARDANRDPATAWRVNAEGTAGIVCRLAEAKAQGRADPLVLISSSAEVYLPRAGHRHTETDAVGPGTAYAASKLGAELAGRVAWRAVGLRVVVARPFPHIGPGQAATFWVARRARVLVEARRRGAPAVTVGDLTAVRDFLHVDDVVDAYVALLSAGTPGEVYNVASGEPVTLEAVHARLETLIGVHPVREQDAAEMRPDARPYHVGDAAKLRAATGWCPRRSLDQALKDVVDAQAD
jgi:GDP-4-dehydro-6-deoxy-D-mannose reductase